MFSAHLPPAVEAKVTEWREQHDLSQGKLLLALLLQCGILTQEDLVIERVVSVPDLDGLFHD